MAKNLPANAGDTSFFPWVGKIHWRSKWQPTPVFLTKKSNKERSLVDPQGHKRDGHDLATEQQQHNSSTCHVGQTNRGAPYHSS